MPRYSYVVCYPVLIAICVVVNIHRYPAVSAMLRGESIASRCLGTTGVFDFQAKQSAGPKSYQGYRSDSDYVVDSRASRTPIPLSDSPATLLTSATSSQSIPASSRFSESGMNTRSNTSSLDRDTGAYDNGYSRSSSSDIKNAGTTGGSLKSGSLKSDSSMDRDSYSDPYEYSNSDPSRSYSHGGTSNGLTAPFTSISSSFDPYNNGSVSDSYSESSSTSLFPTKNEYRGYDDKSEYRNDNIDFTNGRDRSENRSSSDNRYSRPDNTDYYDRANTRDSEFRMDSPMPGYSNRYPADDSIADDNVAVAPAPATAAVQSNRTATVTETEPIAQPTRRSLSLQEKLELRLATPFTFSLSDSQDASYDPYIPPDFLPPHENGIVGKLVDPSAEPPVTITPVTFGSGSLSSDSP